MVVPAGGRLGRFVLRGTDSDGETSAIAGIVEDNRATAGGAFGETVSPSGRWSAELGFSFELDESD